MTDEPALFDIPDAPGSQIQVCDICDALEVASDDGIRVLGWGTFNGLSFTGKPVTATVCPACRGN